MANISNYSPRSGRLVAADGTVKNVVDLLGGGTPVSDRIHNINQYSPSSGIVIGEDGKEYDLTEMLSGGGSGGTVDSQMSDTSFNAVQNKVIKAYVDSKFDSITDYESEVFPNA